MNGAGAATTRTRRVTRQPSTISSLALIAGILVAQRTMLVQAPTAAEAPPMSLKEESPFAVSCTG